MLKRPWPGERVLRRYRPRPVHIKVIPLRLLRPLPTASSLLILGFAAIIVAGSLLLLLPFSARDGKSPPPLAALFTSTSAVTVTGLAVTNIATYWSGFGQGVILVLVQVGGLGFMAFSTLFLILSGRRITLRERLILTEAAGMPTPGGIVRLMRGIIIMTFIIEGLGFIFITVRMLAYFPWYQALWQGLFHTVSAFNNSGLSIVPHSQSLGAFRLDWWLLLGMASLIVLGGLGYTVIVNLFPYGRRRLALDTRIVLVGTALLLFAGTAMILLTEYNNPETLGSLPWPERVLNAFFSAVAPRTAGFSVIPMAMMAEASLFFMMGLMFIGGASGSTAGGVKVNTAVILLASVWSAVRGRDRVVIFDREIAPSQIARALAVVFLAALLVFGVVLGLTATEKGKDFFHLLFETISAFGTVGLSMGITPQLTPAGQLLIIAAMFVGRLGPLTIALSLAQRQQAAAYHFSQERVKIG